MIRGEAQATLKDGRTLTLAMGFLALSSAASRTRIPAADIFKILQKDDGRQMEVLFALIQGSLRKYHREIGEDELDQLMLSDSDTLSDAVTNAMNGAFSDTPEEVSEGNAPLDGTGTNSKKTGQKLD